MKYNSNKTEEFLRSRKLRSLRLNECYIIKVKGKLIKTRFIKVTPKGYNFVSIGTGICENYPHMYPAKNTYGIDPAEGNILFWISSWLELTKTNN